MEKSPYTSSSDAFAQIDATYLPRRRRGFFRGLFGWISGMLRFILATILFFALMTVGIYWLVSNILIPPGELNTPDVRGKPFLEAAKELRNHNLSLKWERDQPSESVPEGNIISQQPEPNKRIKKGSPIRVVVSGGLALAPMPDLRRVTQNRAQALLRKAGLEVGNRTLMPSTTDPVGTVLATDPPAGAGVPQGSKVNLLVTTGHTRLSVAMPNLKGMKLDQARDALTQAGLFATEAPTTEEGAAPGSVVSQSPAAGELVSDNTHIVIKYVPTTSEEGPAPQAAGETGAANGAAVEEFPGAAPAGAPGELPAVTLPTAQGPVAPGQEQAPPETDAEAQPGATGRGGEEVKPGDLEGRANQQQNQ